MHSEIVIETSIYIIQFLHADSIIISAPPNPTKIAVKKVSYLHFEKIV